MNMLNELNEKLKKYKEAKCDKVRLKFKEGDTVKIISQNKLGRVDCLHFDEKKDKVWVNIKLNVTRSIGWSNSTEYIDEDLLEDLEKIDFNEEDYYSKINEVKHEIDSVQAEIDKITLELRNKKITLEKALRDLQKNCIHKWGEFIETGDIKKHMVG